AVTATVMGDDPVPLGHVEHHVSFPVVPRQRPPVTEDDGLPRAPVLVEDLDPVLGGDRAHVDAPSLSVVLPLRAVGRPAIARCLSPITPDRERLAFDPRCWWEE